MRTLDIDNGHTEQSEHVEALLQALERDKDALLKLSMEVLVLLAVQCIHWTGWCSLPLRAHRGCNEVGNSAVVTELVPGYRCF